MKYYLYISDSKVDMLLSQIPHQEKKKIATEFKIDLKILTASRKTEADQENNRIAKLEVVTTFIREFGNVGSVDEPDEYIQDQLQMRWGPYLNIYSMVNVSNPSESPIVYFGGKTERTIVGLGGSSKHLIGHSGQSHGTHSHSATPSLISFLIKELGLNQNDERLKLPYGDLLIDLIPEDIELSNYGSLELDAVELATNQMNGPIQQLEFVAKRLLYGRDEYGNQVLLATPIYVAMAE